MPRLRVKGIAFDMYGTVVDVGAVAEACKAVAPDPVAFTAQWRAKQLEYTFLRSAMGQYQDFWRVSEQALEFTIRRFGLTISADRQSQLMEAWLEPTPYPEVPAVLSRLKERYPLAILSNGSPKMLQVGLARNGLRSHFRWVLSAHAVRVYKPSPKVYRLGPQAMELQAREVLFVSSNSFDVVGSKSFGFTVGWINPDPPALRVAGVGRPGALASVRTVADRQTPGPEPGAVQAARRRGHPAGGLAAAPTAGEIPGCRGTYTPR